MAKQLDYKDTRVFVKVLRDKAMKLPIGEERDALSLAADTVDYTSSLWDATPNLANLAHLVSSVSSAVRTYNSIPLPSNRPRGGRVRLPKERKVA